MKPKTPKVPIPLTIRKFDGDDIYSWAVFRKADVKGLKGPVFYGQAKPLVTGLSRTSAEYEKKVMEARQLQQ